jgi:hypothetical protein
MRIAMLLPLLLLVGCVTGPDTPPKLTEKQTQALEKDLAGKVAGEKVSCISQSGGNDMHVISDDVLLYRISRNLVYKNELLGRCAGLSRGDTLVVELHGSQYCRGDLARVVDLTTGMLGGGCALGDFIPYRTPGH